MASRFYDFDCTTGALTPVPPSAGAGPAVSMSDTTATIFQQWAVVLRRHRVTAQAERPASFAMAGLAAALRCWSQTQADSRPSDQSTLMWVAVLQRLAAERRNDPFAEPCRSAFALALPVARGITGREDEPVGFLAHPNWNGVNALIAVAALLVSLIALVSATNQ